MIAYIKGTVEYFDNEKTIIENGGIGYNIFMPQSQLSALRIDDEIRIYTYFNVREDAMQLYGFLTTDDLNVFKLLLTVNGIGPKGALAILSSMTSDDLRVAVMSSDAKTIAKSPGIGAKTAQRIIIDLKDKLKLEDIIYRDSDDVSPSVNDTSLQAEAVEALVSLGYSQTDAFRAVKAVEITENMDIEAVLKQAFKKII